jgi:hypothetical protein
MPKKGAVPDTEEKKIRKMQKESNNSEKNF